jgi:hypothetical protein
MKPSEGLLTALDGYLDALLSGAGGRTEPAELEPLLAVASELMRSREPIDDRLARWREGLPVMACLAGLGDSFVRAGRWPGLN